MSFLPKKSNRKTGIREPIFPSQRQQLKKTIRTQKNLETLCDTEDDDSVEERPSFSPRSMKKTDKDSSLMGNVNRKFVDMIPTDSSDTSKDDENEVGKTRRQQAKLTLQQKESCSSKQENSKSIRNRRQRNKETSKKSKVSNESKASSTNVLSSEINEQRYITRSNITNDERIQTKIQNRNNTDSSDSEKDEICRMPSVSKRLPKRATQKDIKKNVNLCNRKQNKNKIINSDSADENIQYKTDDQKESRMNHVTLHNEKQKNMEDKLLKSYRSEIHTDNSDSGSSKEFQKSKFFRSNHSTLRRLANLKVDYTKPPSLEESFENIKNTDGKCNNQNNQSDLSFNDVRLKNILDECKIECSKLEKFIQSVGQDYNEEDEENIVLKFAQKINKCKTILGRKQNDLIAYYQSWSTRSKHKKSVGRTLHKKAIDDERTLKQINAHKEHMDENELHNSQRELENKDVSECDSDKIFSGDETRTCTRRTTRNIVDTFKNKNIVDYNNIESVNENETLMRISNKSDSENDLNDSPVLGTLNEVNSEKKSGRKRLISESGDSTNNKKQLTVKDINSTDKHLELDNNKTDTYLVKKNKPESLLQNNEQNTSAAHNDRVNNSSDLFDITFDNSDTAKDLDKVDVTMLQSLNNTNRHKADSTIYDDKETANKNNRISSSPAHDNVQKRNSSNENQEKVSAGNIEKNSNVNDSKESDITEKINIENNRFSNEVLTKNSLQDSDSDISGDVNSDKNNAVSDDSSINSSDSTIILPAKNKNAVGTTNVKEFAANQAESKIKSKLDSNLYKKRTLSINHENNEVEETAKKALLESDSDDSTILSSDLEQNVDDIQLNIAPGNAEDKKKAVLLSSSSESSNSELSETEMRKHLPKISCNREANPGSSKTPKVKKGKFKFNRNHVYMNDEKLIRGCKVCIQKLNNEVLQHYSHALQKSREYLENKTIESLVNLDTLKKKSKKNITKDNLDTLKKKSKKDITKDYDISMDDILSKTKKINKQGKANKEESLMDHLKKIENGEMMSISQTDSNFDESIHQAKETDEIFISNEDLILQANYAAKQNLLNSSDSVAEMEVISNSDSSNADKDKRQRPKKTGEKRSEEKSKKDKKSNWRRHKMLTMKFSDTDSDVEKEKWDKTQEKAKENNSDSDDKEEKSIRFRKKRARRQILNSDSDIKITDCSTDSDNSSEGLNAKKQSSDSNNTKKGKDKQKYKKRKNEDSKSSNTDSSMEEKKPKPKRKRIKVESDSDSDTISNLEGTPGKSGRKNIRKVLKDKQVASDTKQAAKEEEERVKRIAERQALYNQMYDMRLAGEEKVEKLVLDFNVETKEELVSVHKELVQHLKPHQAQGIKFMWDACFESLERMKTTSGSGCIIAHCMGLGKTLQVITLTHTLLTHEATGIKTVLVICPLSTVLNWVHEYSMWLDNIDDDINVYEITKYKKNIERKYQLQRWQRTGGVFIMGYEMFRNLTGPSKNIRQGMKEALLEYLIDPGANLIICDEGHLLKNEETALSKCIRQVKTKRRIVLTGTPLQNNLIEYHCMVQFVKPNLLGTKSEFLNRFVNPITNGQFDDSTAYDVKLMKKRAHVLHKMLEGCVQRFDYSVLTPFLPPKQEYVIFVRLTDVQIKMYTYYLENLARRQCPRGGSLFADFQALQRIWTHPLVLHLHVQKIEKANEKKELSSDSEGSLRDFINDDTSGSDSSSSNESNSNEKSSDSDVQAIDDVTDNTNVSKHKTTNISNEKEPVPPPKEDNPVLEWWLQFIQSEHVEDMRTSAKLLLLFGILRECEQIGDKVLIFSQSLYSLTLIEKFLSKIDDETQKNESWNTLDNHTGSWSLGVDYFRLDGQTTPENRSLSCNIFNKPSNTRARLFLISTRAGGLGINLTAANRVIIFDASWNPSHDVQSIFRIYRFGQKKPCYVYRLLAAGTMEEKIYNRQVTKLSLSCRVVDEQQIERHYSNHNLNELYTFDSYDDKARPTLILPKDRLLAEIFLNYKDVVESYHEHDSLLENKAEEELDEEERKQAWLEYEEEKKGKPLMYPMPTYQGNMIPQNNMQFTSYEDLQQLIRKDYPNASLEQQKMITNRALIDMYNYWEQQAVVQPPRNLAAQQVPQQQQSTISQLQLPRINLNTNQSITNMVQRNALPNMNTNQSITNMVQRNALPNPLYRTQTNNTGKNDDDVIEVLPSTTNNVRTINIHKMVQSATTNKNQEE